MSELTNLETVCDKCLGVGGKDYSGEWEECDCCKGYGYIPTEIGARILDLVRHNTRVNVTTDFRVSQSRAAS